ncbi:hypothetical protein HPB50_018635 [Hyalomma asiaticum]|uniref:Uncharacterized protein n=1 Tax=Hyalomma asiaticum TaxID=266040 RepID=A0ACB7S3M7_HYAAI|nr:hypothetical protein HPB50_018635 [Hyalomma asiaticum]
MIRGLWIYVLMTTGWHGSESGKSRLSYNHLTAHPATQRYISTVPRVALTAAIEAPKLQPFSFPGSVKPGSRISAMCWTTSGSHQVTMSWLKDGNDLSTAKNVFVETKRGLSTILIEPVEVSNAGNYTCIAKNRAGFDSYTAVLDVQAPPSWKKTPGDVRVNIGDRAIFECLASGSPAPKISWRKEGSVINLISSSNGSLLIDDVSIDDAGQYICEADNGIVPTVTHGFTVTVNAPPRIKPFSFPKVASKGEKISVVCLVSEGTLPFSFSWSKDGKELQTTDNVQVKAEHQYSVIFINSVDERSAGNYTCIVKNIFGFDSYSAYLDVEAPPRIKPFSFLKVASKGEKVSIICLVSEGTPPFSFSWSKEGKELQTTENVKVKAEPEYSVAFINSVDEKSAGNYTCIVKNIYGFDSYSAYLDVEAPPVLKKTTPDTNVVQGGSVTLTCHATGSPKPTVKWSKPPGTAGEGASPTDNARMQASPNGTLFIEEVTAEDAGKYTCTAQNAIGSVSHSMYLHVRAPPKIKPFSFAKVASKGEKISILCLVTEGTPPFSFSWSKDGKEVQTTESVKVRTESDYSLTIISSIDERSAGNYTCIVKNIFGFDTHSAYLDVEAPPVFKKTTADTNVVQGGSVVLTCHATGSPKPTVQWSRSSGGAGEVVLSAAADSRIRAFPNGTVLIDDVTAEDAGKYTCKAHNGIGSVSHSLYLHVREVAPAIQQIVASSKVNAGEKATAACLLKRGSEPMTFQWLRNNVDASLLPNVRVLRFEDYLLLVIDPASAESSGNYTCAATNAFGSDAQTAHIEVSVPPAWKKVPGDTEVREGGNRSFQCIAFGSPKPNVTWSKKEESRDGWMRLRADSRFSFEGSTMTIVDLQLSDTGTYSCVASNGVGQGITATFQLRVNDAPVVTPFSFPTDLSEGSSAQVFCAISKGALPVYFTWLKDGKTVSGDNVKVTTSERFSVLQVLQVSAADVGNYTCFAKNLQGSDSYSVKLEVRAPPRWLRVPTDVSALLGSEAKLSCPVAGYPTPKVTWSKMADGNRARLEASQSVTLDPNGVLVLHSVRPQDRGVYLCEADNGVGEPIANRVRLALNVPARFEEKSTVVTARRTEVTRMKCQATGDQPLSIAWSKGSVKLDKRTSARYEVFETLTPDGLISELVIRDTDRSDGALYTCHTQNKYGKDDRKVKLIVQEVPGPPQDVRLKDVWSRSASVSWSPSYSGNSPISKYIVQYWRDHGT